MVKQFLLNKDGSMPENLQALIDAGVLLVMPTEMPRQSGMVAVEQEPQQVDGVWRQVWVLEPVPEALENNEPDEAT
jgi:hypothetical protein